MVNMPRQVVRQNKGMYEEVREEARRGGGDNPVHGDPQPAIHTIHTSPTTRKGVGCQGKVSGRLAVAGWRMQGKEREGKKAAWKKEWEDWKELALGAQGAIEVIRENR
jgi:hypothetical protein